MMDLKDGISEEKFWNDREWKKVKAGGVGKPWNTRNQ